VAGNPTQPLSASKKRRCCESKVVEQSKVSLMLDLLSQLAELGNVEIFLELCRRSELAEDLATGRFSVFVPTDKAFSLLPEPLFRALWSAEELQIDLLEHHLIPGSRSLQREQRVATVQGSRVRVTAQDYDGARLIGPAVRCSNGVIRRVNQVGCPSYGVPNWPVELRLRWALADIESDRSFALPRSQWDRESHDQSRSSHSTVALH
jgi:uncharacterized surface protein with fasciclin (FAS1) repeats